MSKNNRHQMIKTIFRSSILWLRRKYAKHPGIVASAILHIFLILFLIGGLPNLFKDKEKDIIPISVVLAPEKEKPTQKKSEPAPKAEKPKPKTSPVNKIVSKPKPPPPPKPKPAPKKEAPKAKVKPKAEPAKPKAIKKTQPRAIDSILKNLEKDIKDEANTSPAPKTPATEDIDIGMTNREISLIIKQISDNWSMIPTGTGSLKDISVDLRLSLARDGAVKDVKIIDKSRYNSPSESFYRAAADSAVRATHRASPFKNLPLRKYETWKELHIVFHPQ